MKPKRASKTLNPFNLKKQFPIAKPNWPVEQQTKEAFLSVMAAGLSQRDQKRVDRNAVTAQEKALASIATSAWKAKSRLGDAPAAEDSGLWKRINSDLQRILDVIEGDLGWEIRNHTGNNFDYGMALKVVTTQPTTGIDKERVLETIKPTIYDKNNKDRIIQIGEVVIATPA